MTSEVEGEDPYPSVSQFETFFITSMRLSLGTKSVSTSGWRLIPPATNPLNSTDSMAIRPGTNQVLCPRNTSRRRSAL